MPRMLRDPSAIDEIIHLYSTLPTTHRIAALARVTHELTVCGRAAYTVQADTLEDPRRLSGIYKIFRIVSQQLTALWTGGHRARDDKSLFDAQAEIAECHGFGDEWLALTSRSLGVRPAR